MVLRGSQCRSMRPREAKYPIFNAKGPKDVNMEYARFLY